MSVFKFKHFDLHQSNSALKVGTDAMLLGALMNVGESTNLLDIGCGTGVLSLMAAQNNSRLCITAIDIDQGSIQDCQTNFNFSSFSNRFTVIEGDFLECDFKNSFDLIVSNPPYYQSTLKSTDKRIAVAKHSFSLPPNSLLARVSSILTGQGSFWVIVPSVDEESWVDKAQLNSLNLNTRVIILNKEEGEHKRSILNFSKLKAPMVIQELVIRKGNGDYTQQYIDLTKDFHFKDLSGQ